MRNSGACLKAQCEPSNNVSLTRARWPVSLGRIGLKSQIFFSPSHLAPSLGVIPFKFMEKLYGSEN